MRIAGKDGDGDVLSHIRVNTVIVTVMLTLRNADKELELLGRFVCLSLSNKDTEHFSFSYFPPSFSSCAGSAWDTSFSYIQASWKVQWMTSTFMSVTAFLLNCDKGKQCCLCKDRPHAPGIDA